MQEEADAHRAMHSFKSPIRMLTPANSALVNFSDAKTYVLLAIWSRESCAVDRSPSDCVSEHICATVKGFFNLTED